MTMEDHPVVDAIYRAVKNTLGLENEEIIDEMKATIKKSK